MRQQYQWCQLHWDHYYRQYFNLSSTPLRFLNGKSKQGIKTLYLLTTTAAQFFAKRGYEAVPRSEAPAAIAATAQFSDLCPASSAFMRKALAANNSLQARWSFPRSSVERSFAPARSGSWLIHPLIACISIATICRFMSALDPSTIDRSCGWNLPQVVALCHGWSCRRHFERFSEVQAWPFGYISVVCDTAIFLSQYLSLSVKTTSSAIKIPISTMVYFANIFHTNWRFYELKSNQSKGRDGNSRV